MCVRLAFGYYFYYYMLQQGGLREMMYSAAEILTQNNLPSPHLVIQAHFRIFPQEQSKSSPSVDTLSLSPRLYVHFAWKRPRLLISPKANFTFQNREKMSQTLFTLKVHSAPTIMRLLGHFSSNMDHSKAKVIKERPLKA